MADVKIMKIPQFLTRLLIVEIDQRGGRYGRHTHDEIDMLKANRSFVFQLEIEIILLE